MYKENKLLSGLALAMLILSIFFTIGIIFDQRLILGINPWIKPLKFSVSILIYSITMIIVLRHHSTEDKLFYSKRFFISMVIEIFFITLQAFRGVKSHFNQNSIFDSTIFTIMGLAIFYNTFYVFKLTKDFFKRPSKLFSQNELMTIRYGLVLFLIGSLEGFYMSTLTGHTVGGTDGGPGIYFVNWSAIAGDLRIAHFLGLHGIQILLLFYYFPKLLNLNIQNSKSISIMLNCTYSFILFLTFFSLIQALMGKSILSLF